MRVCAFTSVCQEDLGWVDQYIIEAERLHIPFAIHLDRCNIQDFSKLVNHRLCRGYSRQNKGYIEFNETHKQEVMDIAATTGSTWLMAWDIDETYATDLSFLDDPMLQMSHDYINVRWLNLWEDTDHVRVDGPFGSGHRDRFYNNRSGQWVFNHKVVNGPKLKVRGIFAGSNARELKYHDFICLHHGMMTRELREFHKERWDRIYGVAVGKNPYGFWDYALNETEYPPVVKPLKDMLK